MDAPVYVERQAELAAVRACADDALAGRSRVVWIEGPAGAGKTALLDRALELLPGGFAITRAEADELAGDVPFGVVGQLADLPSGAGSFAAGLELVARWPAEQDARPVAVAVEDLHWADLRSRGALLTAARRLGRDRVVLIVTSRPDGTADGWERLHLDQRRCRRIEVAPLSVDEVADLARATGVPLPRWAAERLHRHTAGHALHVRTLLGELDAEQLTRTDGDLPTPRTLASTTVSRLAALPAEARELALALAVVGRAVPLTVAARVAGLTAPTTALDQLLTTGLATWRSGPTGPVVGFAHPLYRAALYDDLAPIRRQRLHRAAAEALGATRGWRTAWPRPTAPTPRSRTTSSPPRPESPHPASRPGTCCGPRAWPRTRRRRSGTCSRGCGGCSPTGSTSGPSSCATACRGAPTPRCGTWSSARSTGRPDAPSPPRRRCAGRRTRVGRRSRRARWARSAIYASCSGAVPRRSRRRRGCSHCRTCPRTPSATA